MVRSHTRISGRLSGWIGVVLAMAMVAANARADDAPLDAPDDPANEVTADTDTAGDASDTGSGDTTREPEGRPRATPADADTDADTDTDDADDAKNFARKYGMGDGLERGEGGANVHGYGEMHLNVPMGAGRSSADFHRFIIGIDYEFTDSIRFGSEVEIEHSFIAGGTAAGGEVELEQAWLEFDLFDEEAFGLSSSIGILLLPVGRVNFAHEPTAFFSVERPQFYSNIVPTTWFEPGAQVAGRVGENFSFILGVYAGLQGEGLSASSGIRGGRQKANSKRFIGGADGSSFAGPNFAGRVQFQSPGLIVGVSGFASRLDQNNQAIPLGSWAWGVVADVDFTPPVPVLEAFRFIAAIGYIHIARAGAISTALGKAANDGISEKLFGYYGELAVNVLHFAGATSEKLWVFVRFEDYDTQNKMPAGFVENARYDRQALSTGIAFFPAPNVVLKITYTDFMDARTNAKPNDQWDFGFGFEY